MHTYIYIYIYTHTHTHTQNVAQKYLYTSGVSKKKPNFFKNKFNVYLLIFLPIGPSIFCSPNRYLALQDS